MTVAYVSQQALRAGLFILTSYVKATISSYNLFIQFDFSCFG